MWKADVYQRTTVLESIVCESVDVCGDFRFDRQYNVPTHIPTASKKSREEIATWN